MRSRNILIVVITATTFAAYLYAAAAEKKNESKPRPGAWSVDKAVAEMKTRKTAKDQATYVTSLTAQQRETFCEKFPCAPGCGRTFCQCYPGAPWCAASARANPKYSKEWTIEQASARMKPMTAEQQQAYVESLTSQQRETFCQKFPCAPGCGRTFCQCYPGAPWCGSATTRTQEHY